jgi:hypothetical protein
MAQDLKKFIKISLTLIFLSSCSESNLPLDNLLIHKYANLSFNNEKNKEATLKKLQVYLTNHEVTDKNIFEIEKILNEINDGHVILKKTNSANDPLAYNFGSDLKYVPGTFFVETCLKDCSPAILQKSEIVEVDGISFEKWIEHNKGKVQASSEWGRKYRTSRLLINNRINLSVKLKLKTQNGKVINSQLSLKKLVIQNPFKCVEGKRIDKLNFLVKINSFWCDRGRLISDQEIFNEFKQDWDESTNNIKETDHIILDLRENNGGGDNEVMYSLSSLFDHPVFLYKFQFLKSTLYGKRNWLNNFIHFNSGKWANAEVEYSLKKYQAKNKFFKNPISILISSGCFSSCEGFAHAVMAEKRGILKGSVTHGGAGDPKFYRIKNSDYLINLPSCLVWQKDGKFYEGVGITPNIKFLDTLNLKGDGLLQSVLKN